jgi:hypothetical protein
MALPPTIPTSFVPHATTGETSRLRSGSIDALSLLAYALFVIVFALALGVFFYGRLLAAEKTAKDAALVKAEQGIELSTVEGFVQLRNRLNFGETLLKKHASFSNFFSTLETLLPSSVRFNTLHLSFDPLGVAKLEGSGTAKSFNALAAASGAFAADGRIKDAIFSKISINKDNTVAFSLSASLDPKILSFAPVALPSLDATQETLPADTSAATTAPAL